MRTKVPSGGIQELKISTDVSKFGFTNLIAKWTVSDKSFDNFPLVIYNYSWCPAWILIHDYSPNKFISVPGISSSTCDIMCLLLTPYRDRSPLKMGGLERPCTTFLNREHERKVWSQTQQQYGATWQLNHCGSQSSWALWQYTGPNGCLTSHL